jgi:hypothetical protein
MMDGKLFCDPASKSNILNRQFKSAFSAKTKFTKKEFIKSKRMDPSIKHQTMKPFNITTPGSYSKQMLVKLVDSFQLQILVLFCILGRH